VSPPRSRQGCYLEYVSAPALEPGFADLDLLAHLPFHDLGFSNPLAGWFPEDLRPSIVTPLNCPYGGLCGTPGIQNQPHPT